MIFSEILDIGQLKEWFFELYYTYKSKKKEKDMTNKKLMKSSCDICVRYEEIYTMLEELNQTYLKG